MRRSREEAAETRRRAVEAASKLYRERGLDAVSVADVMGDIGMTAGGFYRHFGSREALMREACAHAFAEKRRAYEAPRGSGRPATVADIFNRYLTARHRDTPATGCPIPPLLSSVSHHSAEMRRLFTEGMLRQLDQIASRSPGAGTKAHIAAAASMFGALALARAVDDEALSDRILSQTREYWLEVLEEKPTSATNEEQTDREIGRHG